jgi:transposase
MQPERDARVARAPQDVAVDVHKERLAVLAQDRDGVELWRRRFPATAAGEAELRACLQPEDRVVLEATRGSHRLALQLEMSGASVLILDPGQASLIGHRGKKTDYRDCRALLKHFHSGDYATVWRPDAATRALRFLTGERLSLNQGITRTKNRMKALLHEEGLVAPGELLWTEDGLRWLAVQPLPPTTRDILLRAWRSLHVLAELKAEAENEALATVAVERAEVARLMQITGFGMVIAVLFLGQVGAVRRFATSKQVVSYAGLNPRVKQSDRYVHTGPISKAGRAPLRWLMVEAAWVHVQAGGPLAHVYHRLVAKGKKPGVAIVALARKLLVLAYTLLRDESAYADLNAPAYERKLRELAAKRPVTEAPQETHRDWAAGRFAAVTGTASPYRQEHPEPGKARLRRKGAGVRAAAAAVPG